ncbi:MAG TPA: hypothetical protein PKD53_07685 [Chloroflexaceae bacterium]|nr:hypothetical protein [Chloroflexaceae bacterium]
MRISSLASAPAGAGQRRGRDQCAAITAPQRLPATALDQLAFLFRSLSDGQIRCVLRFDGRLDAARLERAMRLSLDAEPVLGCRFVQRRGRCVWERHPDLDRLRLCQVVASGEPLDAALEEFLVAPLEPATGPVVAACLLRGEADTLAIKLHHFAADGIGLLQYLMTLAAIYRELGANPDYRPRPNLAGRGQGQVLRRVGLLGIVAALRHTRPPARQAPWGPIAAGGERSGRRFALRRLGPERVRALRAWGRAHGVSVNDLLLAALYEALAATVGAPLGRPLTIGVPIDLRRYLPAGQALPVCNLSNSADVAVVRAAGSGFAATLRQVHAGMRAIKTTGRGLNLAVLAELLALPALAPARAALEGMLGRLAPTAGVSPFFSNVGVIDERLVNFGERAVIAAYGLGPVSFAPGLLVTASTFRETLTLAVGFCDTATDPRLVERILDRLVDELPA